MKKIIIYSSIVIGAITIAGGKTVFAASDNKEQKATVSLEGSTDPGALKIAGASDLVFGAKQIGAGDLDYDAINSPSVTIEDIRGAADGWNVSVALGAFSDAGKSLKGVQLFYPAVTMTTNTTSNVDGRIPTSIATDNSLKDSEVKGVLVADNSQGKTLFNAAVGKGNGQWKASYDQKKVELRIPAGNLAGNYEAKLTYTLADAPTQP